MTAENISKKAIEMLKDPEVVQRITHLDQDVLNILLVNKARFVDKNFNTQFSLNYELKDSVINPVNADTVFVHYIGPTKPWHSWGAILCHNIFYRLSLILHGLIMHF